MKKKTTAPYKPMTRDDYDAWVADLLASEQQQEAFVDVKAFINDVKRFDPKAGDLLEQLNKLQDRLVEHLRN
jgi:hypothetical protein